ncbi:MAG: MauE/DoxX family redox-associated membrane protein [Planctomycetota bacterium]
MEHEQKSGLRHRLIYGLMIVARLALGGIFIAGSIAKLHQPYDFLGSVYNYELVGPGLGVAVAMVLPWLELFVGICLVGGIFVTGALLASIAMSAMFSIALLSALWRGLEISCGCLDPTDPTVISYGTAGRAILLLLVSAACYAYAVLKSPSRCDRQVTN